MAVRQRNNRQSRSRQYGQEECQDQEHELKWGVYWNLGRIHQKSNFRVRVESDPDLPVQIKRVTREMQFGPSIY